MRFVRERARRGAIINITSLIDVMFLLVIFVLLSAKFEPEGGIAVDLPKGKSIEVPKTKTFDLVITHDFRLYLQKEPVEWSNLRQAIEKARSSLEDPVLIIRADKTVPWEKIVLATDDAKLAGQTKINFKIKP